MAVRTRPARPKRYRSLIVKRLYLLLGGIVIGVVLTVLYVPGIGQYIEQTVLGLVSGWAS